VSDTELSRSVGKRILHDNSERQVSAEAADELVRILELYAGDIAEEAVAQARDDDRKTVRLEDIERALE
jgi:Histone-like transcription factor (CBF/NF-Y) and archaeal histone.